MEGLFSSEIILRTTEAQLQAKIENTVCVARDVVSARFSLPLLSYPLPADAADAVPS